MIEREVPSDGDTPYRRADLRLLVEPPLMEIDLSNERLRLTALFSDGRLQRLPLGRQFMQMLSSPLPTADVVDLIAFNLLDDVPVKQRLLAEVNPRRRAQRVIAALDAMRPILELARRQVHPRRQHELTRAGNPNDEFESPNE